MNPLLPELCLREREIEVVFHHSTATQGLMIGGSLGACLFDQ